MYVRMFHLQEFSWKSPAGIVRGSKCTNPENQPGLASSGLRWVVGKFKCLVLIDTAMNFALERYGGQSRCFFQDKAWSERTCQYTRTWQHWGSGCYDVREKTLLSDILRLLSLKQRFLFRSTVALTVGYTCVSRIGLLLVTQQVRL